MHLTFHGMRAYLDWRLKSTSNNMVVEMTYGSAKLSTGIIFCSFLFIFLMVLIRALVLCFGPSTSCIRCKMVTTSL